MLAPHQRIDRLMAAHSVTLLTTGAGEAGTAGRLPQGGCHSPLHPGRMVS